MIPNVTIRDILIRNAKKYGDRTYLFFDNKEVSYAQLANNGIAVAQGLIRGGVQKGDRVASLLPNGVDFFDVFFGIASAGALMVAINPLYKMSEIKYILNHSEAETLIIAPDLWPNFEIVKDICPKVKRIYVLGGEASETFCSFKELYLKDNKVLLPDLEVDDPVVLMYTSGTTGRPKAVILTHQNYISNAFQGGMSKKYCEHTKVLTALPLVHSNAQVSSFLASFVMGGQLVLQKAFRPKEFLEAISEYKITTFGGVPTIYAILLNQPDLERYDLSHLTYCICGSAPISVALFKKFEETFKTNILEGYGLSECVASASLNPVDGIRKVGSIGIPIPCVNMCVQDEDGHDLGPREIGEILIAGPNVMKGYFRDPEATAETIRGGWLHTGDLGYRDEDGYYFLVGRKKEMIIRGGQNIYPKEIEEAIYTHPKVLEAAVIGLPDDVWGERVHACIILKEGEEIDLEELRGFLADKLAEFNLPVSMSLHKEFPKRGIKILKSELVETITRECEEKTKMEN